MKIHHIRNATMVLETGDKAILIDPMLGKKGTAAPPFAFIRFKAKRNPIVDLPEHAEILLRKTTHCLITHLHADHLDKEGEHFLRDGQIPVYCSVRDEQDLKKRGLNVVKCMNYWKEDGFLGGSIQGIPARHGYGYIAKPMGNVMGFFITLPGEKSVYLSSDTIYTTDVHRVLTEFRPEISVLACGSAQLDLFQPLLMRMDDLLKFITDAPGFVIANHLEAVNHCPTKRAQLRKEVAELGLLGKVFIPEDGELNIF